MSRLIRAASTAALAALLSMAVLPALAVAAPVEASAASGTGVKIYADLVGFALLNQTITTTKAPDPAQPDPNNTSASFTGPVRYPNDGSLVSDVSALRALASRTSGDLPTAKGEAHTGHVMLLEQGGKPMIGVDAIDAVSATACTAPGKASVSAAGSRLVGLVIAGTPYEVTPQPNTVVPLVYTGDPANPDDDMGIKVILNEQRGADAGTGLLVTMIHVIAFSPVNPNLIYADVRIAEAMSTVFCGNSTPPTNDNDDKVVIDKVVTTTTSDPAGATDGSTATVHRAEEVTWKISITNNGDLGCGILSVTDVLPQHFTFVRSSGDLTTGAGAATTDPDGREVTWTKPGRYSLAAGGTLTETVVAKVSDAAPYGTYTNLVNITQSTCSSFTQGLRGPVDVIPVLAVLNVRRVAPRPPPAAPTGTLPATGVATVMLGLVALAASGAGLELLRRGR